MIFANRGRSSRMATRIKQTSKPKRMPKIHSAIPNTRLDVSKAAPAVSAQPTATWQNQVKKSAYQMAKALRRSERVGWFMIQ